MMPYSGDRRLSPPPPLPPHATLSYLSPSAAPFTVSRSRSAAPDPIADANAHAPANPSPYPDLPTAPSLYESWVEPPPSYMDPAAAAAPGYAGFAKSDGFLLPESVPNDIYSGNHFGTSMQQPYPFTTGSSEWMEEKYPGIYQRTSKALSSDFGSSVVHQPSLPLSMLACLDKKPCSTSQPVNQYPEYSAYDNYISHLPSCSTYPLNCDLSIRSVAASPEVCAATKTSPSTTDGHTLENAFTLPYMNPCRLNLDYFDTMKEQKDLNGYRTTYENCGEWSSSGSGMRLMENYPLSSRRVGENYLVGESSGTRRPVQPSSEVKSGLKCLQASSCKVSPSERAFAQPRDLFTEPHEVNNPVVDSPCWKGTPTAKQRSFGVLKNDEAPYSANCSDDLHDLHQGKKLPEFSINDYVSFSKHHDTSNLDNGPCLPYCTNYLSAFSMPLECKRSKGHGYTQTSSIEPFNSMAKSNHLGYVCAEQGTRRDKHMTCKMGDDSENMVTPGQQGSVFPVNKTNESVVLVRNIDSHVGSMSEESVKKVSSTVGTAPTSQVRSLTKGSPQGNPSCVHKAAATWENLCSEMPMNRGLEHLTHCNQGVEEDVVKISSDKVTCRSKTQAEFIKSMHNLSVMLLSTCNGGYELDDYEHALVQSVIQNLNSLSSKISKVSLEVDDVNSNCCEVKSEKINYNGETYQPEKFAELDLGNIGTEFKTFVLQNLTKLPEENVVCDTKDAQMLVYKNLWIEAEASMCKLKYELQLTRMKLSMKCHNKQTAASPADSSGETKASNLPKSENSLCIGELDDSSKQQNHAKESNIYSATLLPQGGARCDGQSPEENRRITDKVDADVFARLKVLKLRDENINSFLEDNSELQKETGNYNKTDAVDGVVIDNAVGDSITSLVEDIIKERPEPSKGNEADGARIATLEDFMSCNYNTSSSNGDINQEQLESSKNKADGSAMARLLKLMGCSEDVWPCLKDNAHQRQTANNNEFGQLEDDVMARLQVLRRRVDNTGSVVKEGQGILHSDDWEGHLERKHFGCRAHDGLVEKTNLPDDVQCTALSDEVNDKTAVQFFSTLLENSHVLSAPVEPASLHLHVEQLRHSPSEWEHVLKEDFFLPGNSLK